ncbi:MAG TPA: hypothetical protein VNH64_12080 [Parvularculaceae bacterium]|nr:hypothetical protein [Parvularculaceae bacterium]
MSSDSIERLLQADFEEARAALEHDGFPERLLARLQKGRRARLLVIGGAGGVGAIIAGAQFASISSELAASSHFVRQLTALAENAGFSPAFAPAMLAAGAIAAGFIATAFVLRAEQ